MTITVKAFRDGVEVSTHDDRYQKLAEWQRAGLVKLGNVLDRISGCDYIPTATVGDFVLHDDPREQYPTEEFFARVALAVQGGVK